MKRYRRRESASDTWYALQKTREIYLTSDDPELALTLYITKKSNNYGCWAAIESMNAKTRVVLQKQAAYAQIDSNAIERFAWLDNVSVDESLRRRGLCKIMITQLVRFYVVHGGLYFSGEYRLPNNEVMPQRAFFLIDIVSENPLGARACYLQSMRSNHFIHVPRETQDGLFTMRGTKFTYRLPHRDENEARLYYGERYEQVKEYEKYDADEVGESWHEPLYFHVDGFEGDMPVDLLEGQQRTKMRNIQGFTYPRFDWLQAEREEDDYREFMQLPPRPTKPKRAIKPMKSVAWLRTSGKEEESLPLRVVQKLLENLEANRVNEIVRLKRINKKWSEAITRLEKGFAVQNEKTVQDEHDETKVTVVKEGFWEALAKQCFAGVQELPPDLRAKLSRGEIKYDDAAWYAHLRRTWSWVLGFQILVSGDDIPQPTLIDRTTKDITCKSLRTDAVEYIRPLPADDPNEDIAMVNESLASEISDSRGGSFPNGLEIAVVYNGVKLFGRTWNDNFADREFRKFIFGDNMNFESAYYGDRKEFEEYDENEYSYETVPDFYEDFGLEIQIYWKYLTPDLCSTIQEALDAARNLSSTPAKRKTLANVLV